MYCQNCGSMIQDGARFCTTCGAMVQQAPQHQYYRDFQQQPSQQHTPQQQQFQRQSTIQPPPQQVPQQNNGSILTVHGYKEWYAGKPPIEIYDNNIKIGEVKYNDTIRIRINHDTNLTFKGMMRTATYYVTANENHEVQLSFNRITGRLTADGKSESNYFAQPTQPPQPTCNPQPTYGSQQNYRSQEVYEEDDDGDCPRRVYIDSNRLGALKIYDDDNDCLARLNHSLLSSTYTLVDPDNDFLLRIDETDSVNHVFSISIDSDGDIPIAEVAKRSNFTVGFGLGHFVLLPIASIPFGCYYGVSDMGDIYTKKNGKIHEIYVDDTLIATAEFKKGYGASLMNSKSCLEIFTDDDELISYAVGLFIIMDINDYLK